MKKSIKMILYMEEEYIIILIKLEKFDFMNVKEIGVYLFILMENIVFINFK